MESWGYDMGSFVILRGPDTFHDFGCTAETAPEMRRFR